MKILIIDQQALFREGLCHVLQKLPTCIDQILEAGSFSEGLKQAEQHPDIILLELLTPECDGVRAVNTLRLRYPLIPVVVVSSDEDESVISQSLKYGVSGYVCKSSSGSVFLRAVELVLAGSIYVPMQFLQHRNGVNSESTNSKLTNRQQQVLALLLKQYTNKEIAREINLAEGTVKVHVAAIFQTLRVNCRNEAVQIAKQIGLA